MKLSKLERAPKRLPASTPQKNFRRLMMKVPWNKILTPIFSAILLALVIYYLPPPKSFIDASLQQIIFFFGPLFLLLSSLINIVVKFAIRSSIFALSIITLLVLLSLDLLNAGTLVGVLLVTFFLVRIIRKSSDPKIPNRIPRISQLKKQ